MDNKRYLTRRESAEFLNELGLPATPQSLAKRAFDGDGPRFYKFGNRAMYTKTDILEWVELKLGDPIMSTSHSNLRT